MMDLHLAAGCVLLIVAIILPLVSDERVAAVIKAIGPKQTPVSGLSDFAHDLRDARAENAALRAERDELRAERDTAEDLLAGRLAITECPSCGEKNMHQWARERRELLTERDSLRAHVNALREAGVAMTDGMAAAANDLNEGRTMSEDFVRRHRDADQQMLDAIASTPEQSLADVKREVVERCARIVESVDPPGQAGGTTVRVAAAIRALADETP